MERSAKDAVGCSLGAPLLWFTLGYGIVNEVYWPRTDLPQIRDLGFIVANGNGFWACECDHRLSEKPAAGQEQGAGTVRTSGASDVVRDEGRATGSSECRPWGPGATLAERWRANCHDVTRTPQSASAGRGRPPSFKAIAVRSSTTTEDLDRHLSSGHTGMPDFLLGPYERRLLIAYILSIR